MSTTETLGLGDAERRPRQAGETDASARAARAAVAVAKDAALYAFRQSQFAARGQINAQALHRAAEKTYYAAIDGSAAVTFTIG
jgi:hypothetical protein